MYSNVLHLKLEGGVTHSFSMAESLFYCIILSVEGGGIFHDFLFLFCVCVCFVPVCERVCV